MLKESSKKYSKKALHYTVVFLLLCLGLLILVDQSIGFYVRQAIYTDIQKLPYRPYGLVLGTSKYFAKNTLNLFYYNRLLATHELFKAKKLIIYCSVAIIKPFITTNR